MTRARGPLVLCGALLAITACGAGSSSDEQDTADQHVITFDTASVRIVTGSDTVRLSVELALTPDQKTMGLMERHHLPENAGMVFAYDSTQPPDAGFWMYRTRIPLDIAFLDSAGIVRAALSMPPCPALLAEGCPTYSPNVPYRYALEVNSGYFARHHVAVGSKVLVSDIPKRG